VFLLILDIWKLKTSSYQRAGGYAEV
jgi:hypothetical protein